MKYMDEKILKRREEKKKECYTSIETGIYIDGKVIEFRREEVEDIFSLMLPQKFKLMPEKFAQVKYPSVFRPRYIYTNGNLSVNMGFSLFTNNLVTKGTENTAKRMIEAIKRDNPSHEFYDIDSLQEDKGTWFSFRSHAMDYDMFNMILILRLKKGILQSNFNCLLTKREVWEDVALQMWESIEEYKGDKI